MNTYLICLPKVSKQEYLVFVKPTVNRRTPKTHKSLNDLIDDLNGLSGSDRRVNPNSASRGSYVPRNTSGRGAKSFGRLAGKIVPQLRVISTVMDVANYLTAPETDFPAKFENLGNWTLYAECGSPLNDPCTITANGVYESSALANFAEGCIGGQSIRSTTPFDVHPLHKSVLIGNRYTVFSSNRGRSRQAYTRPETGTPHQPDFKPAYTQAALILPKQTKDDYHVTAFPQSAPPFSAPAFTSPVPYHLSPYWEAPNRIASNGTKTQLLFGEVYNNWSTAIVSVSHQTATADGAPPTHRLAPPTRSGRSNRPTTKERKVRVSGLANAILRKIAMVTETKDIIEAFYDALPSEYRPRYKDTDHELMYPSLYQKMKSLIENGEHIDVTQAFFNLLTEQIEDEIYGQLNRAGGEASILLDRPYGTGLNSIYSRIRREYREHQYDQYQKEKEN